MSGPSIDAIESGNGGPRRAASDAAFAATWEPRLRGLAARIRDAARGALVAAVNADRLDALMQPCEQGAGDVTFGIDVPAEAVLTAWLGEVARERPISLLTEDAGWRHAGPDGRGGVRALGGFDHGGPRIAVDPIDGTRNLMADLRAAWTVIGACAPGAGEPRIGDVALGLVTEIPDTRAAVARELSAARGGGARMREVRLADGALLRERALRADASDRPDHGYFPFFRYAADLRPAVAGVEADFFARLARAESADVRSCYDDQYTSNGGQLVLLALGRYRMIADLRAHLAARRGAPTVTGKPYDVSGALLVAAETGCVVTAPDGAALDFPLDATTPIGFVGWHNPATRARLERHLAAALAE
jgi:fructose-1,6-bisphosphatase/inositol monophosphatase family enzyme